MTEDDALTEHGVVECGRCSGQAWIGDQFCRRCGTALVAESGPDVFEVDLSAPVPKEEEVAGAGSSRKTTWIALAALVLVIGAVIGFTRISGGDNEADQQANEPAADGSGVDGNGVGGSGVEGGQAGDGPGVRSLSLPDNPPERQAALDAFEAARQRRDVTIGEVFDLFGIEGELVVHTAVDSLRMTVDDAEPRRTPLSIASVPAEWEWSKLGPAEAVDYRVNPGARTTIEVWDHLETMWRAADLRLSEATQGAIPFAELSVSPTHLAADAGSQVRIWSRETGVEVAELDGRLVPTTGPGFVVSECSDDPIECGLTLLNEQGGPTGRKLQAAIYAPSPDHPARVSPNGFSVAFVEGTELVVWELGPNIRRYWIGAPIVDVAWVPDGSGLIVLTPDSVLISPLVGDLVRLPIELTEGSNLALLQR